MSGTTTRLAGALALLPLAILAAACGASFDSGVAAPTPTQSVPVIVATSPTPTPSASTCTSPAAVATYQLPGAQTLSGNLQIEDEVVGSGKEAKAGDTVKVDYTGSLPDGKVFDSSVADNSGNPVSLKLAAGSVIQGWVEGIPGMRVGGTRELVIPAALGYGCEAVSSIPVDSTLIFKVTLVAVS
ncbi:MAG: FKBP-type peptidyl-prolyl cis-trans isomerase [Candidatus Dormibacteria bacterium]|jgi:FKBP-type peptidyl-prolyl cis-trans isomerase